jgi:sugar/nucleoside kinase (ribokinase family)
VKAVRFSNPQGETRIGALQRDQVVDAGPAGPAGFDSSDAAWTQLRDASGPSYALDDVALLHLTGYSFFAPGPRATVLGLISEASRRGVPFTVDPSSAAFLRQLEPGAFLGWTKGAAVCFPNRDEAAVLAGPAVPGELADPGADDPRLTAAVLARNYGAVVLKLGADGAVLAMGDAPPVLIPAWPAEVRDTTGAGDAFCAGFVAAWLAEAPLAEAATAAVKAAALAVTVLGGRPGAPEA